MSAPAPLMEFKFRTINVFGGGTGLAGLCSGSRISSTSLSLYSNAALQANVVTPDTGTVSTNPFCSFAEGTGASTATNFAGGTDKFSCFGGGLTDTQITALYSRVQSYQTALGRQV